MDQQKTGALIRARRLEMGLTQAELAGKLMVSDKAVSKWERGAGSPDLSLLPGLSELLEVDLDRLLAGDLEVNEKQGGNMKKTKFYVCPDCGNILTAMGEASVSCCGRNLKPLTAKKAEGEEKLEVEIIENDFYITSSHPMTKEDYILFVALLTGDGLTLKKQYPEWDLSVRIPREKHGQLFWYSKKDGLLYQNI